jgi:hypothetical protein
MVIMYGDKVVYILNTPNLTMKAKSESSMVLGSYPHLEPQSQSYDIKKRERTSLI